MAKCALNCSTRRGLAVLQTYSRIASVSGYLPVESRLIAFRTPATVMSSVSDTSMVRSGIAVFHISEII